ncbi:hypothetical protein V495_03396 [Pseudogymnoascus sp. VKM F-4514 (FW-929)]|nr:hypothetical protein V495_03396 [Pseudogymnoascus sp. VKM F-4514 (FW-929)]KFY58917.1 hypothetical protein V497_04633 [Pseudogymnoascus sp. VKM F-4516 (FW-969)]
MTRTLFRSPAQITYRLPFQKPLLPLPDQNPRHNGMSDDQVVLGEQLERPSDLSPTTTLDALPEYDIHPQDPVYCASRFGLKYLENLRDQSVGYCTADSAANLTCFHSQTASVPPETGTMRQLRTDTMCFGRSANFNATAQKFSLGCESRTLEESEASRVPQLDQFTGYMYATGARPVMNERVVLDRKLAIEQPSRNFTILVKREGAYNPWHSLMEIWSMTMTMDVLRMAKEPGTNAPFFSLTDVDNTQVMILDDDDEGPYFDLWSIFAKRPAVRVRNMTTVHTTSENIIIPLPGASNPIWQGDWNIHNCYRSPLLATFIQRILNFYDIPTIPASHPDIVLTFIDRRSTRRIISQDSHLAALRAHIPHLKVQSIDFATLSFAEQIKVVHGTDILVGVHGAGLTHAMFLPESAVVVEILPEGLTHKGFRNFAALLGHAYFSAHGSNVGSKPGNKAEAEKMARIVDGVAKTNGAAKAAGEGLDEAPLVPVPGASILRKRGSGWQGEDVFLEEKRFLELIEVAVKVMYNKGLRNYDVN